MRSYGDRLQRLEAARSRAGIPSRLVLLTGPHGPTAAQQAQADAARGYGRAVFVITVRAPEGKTS